jgi:hypothetical protein
MKILSRNVRNFGKKIFQYDQAKIDQVGPGEKIRECFIA